MKIKPIILLISGVCVGFIVSGIIWLSASPPRGEAILLFPTLTPSNLSVHVSGAVMFPGVYSLPAGSRLIDAVIIAGGFASGAEQDEINLAQLLSDGDQVDVPGILTTSHITIKRVNINIASASELDALPSIGPTTAQAIIDYRLENGPFSSIQDIKRVPGIGPATFEKIEDYITAGEE